MKKEKTLKKELDKKDFTHKEANRAFRVWTVVHTDEGGYIANDITVHVWTNGDFTISENDGDGFVSIHGVLAGMIKEILAGG